MGCLVHCRQNIDWKMKQRIRSLKTKTIRVVGVKTASCPLKVLPVTFLFHLGDYLRKGFGGQISQNPGPAAGQWAN